MSSASAICDALITMLTSSSVLGASMASINNWGVLERASGCCAVVGFQGYKSVPATFGGGDYDTEEMYFIHAYVKDTANVSVDLNNIQALVTTIANCIQADYSLLGTVDIVNQFTANRRPNDGLQVGGFLWLPIEMTVEVRQL